MFGWIYRLTLPRTRRGLAHILATIAQIRQEKKEGRGPRRRQLLGARNLGLTIERSHEWLNLLLAFHKVFRRSTQQNVSLAESSRVFFQMLSLEQGQKMARNAQKLYREHYRWYVG